MPLVNYHNHTSLCGHAVGTIGEYVEAARKLGISEIGFSDHAPIPEPIRGGITMAPEDTEGYIELVLSAKERYADKISVRLGFEVDYPLFGTFDEKYFSDPRIDYLAGSCHFLGDWAFDHEDFIGGFDKRDIDEIYGEYFGVLEKLAASRLFDFIGHFDLVKKFGHRPKGDFSASVRKVARIMSENGIAAEINTSGLIKPVREIYPSDEIIKILFEENVPITLGSDSHAPSQVGYGFDIAVEKLKRIGYTKISGFEKRIRYDVALG